MHVLIDAVGIHGGGGERLLEVLASALGKGRPGWTWLVCVDTRASSGLKDALRSSGLDLLVIDGASRRGRLRWLFLGIQEVLRDRKASVLFSFANLGPIRPAPCPILIFLQQAKLLDPASSTSVTDRIRLTIMQWFFLLSTRWARVVVVQSEHMLSRLKQLSPRIGARTVVVPSPAVADRTGELRTRISERIAGASSPRLCYVSVFREHKNHKTLLRAFAEVRELFPTASLLLTMEPLELHREVAASGLGDSVVFLGHLSAAEIGQLYSASALMIFPSQEESFGLPLAEAMQSGLPVVASDLPYAREVLGTAGAYFDPKDAKSISTVVGSVLLDEIGRRRMISDGLSRAPRFSPQAAAEGMCVQLERASKSGVVR